MYNERKKKKLCARAKFTVKVVNLLPHFEVCGYCSWHYVYCSWNRWPDGILHTSTATRRTQETSINFEASQVIHVDISQLRDTKPKRFVATADETSANHEKKHTTNANKRWRASQEIIKIEIVLQTEIIWNDLKRRRRQSKQTSERRKWIDSTWSGVNGHIATLLTLTRDFSVRNAFGSWNAITSDLI